MWIIEGRTACPNFIYLLSCFSASSAKDVWLHTIAYVSIPRSPLKFKVSVSQDSQKFKSKNYKICLGLDPYKDMDRL